MGPHITLDRKLREAAESQGSPLSTITGILKTARIAELSSFGKIADDRVRVIKRVEELKDVPETREAAFQKLITEAPWLINPQWSPITANQAFSTLKAEFEKYYKQRTGIELVLNDFSDPNKRCDFILSNQDNIIQIIEIKQPGHALENEEMQRIDKYIEIMRDFLEDSGNKEIKAIFPKYHLTLVCDKLNLSGVNKSAFENFESKALIEHINWRTFLLRTRKMHEEFLKEAERQKQNASNEFER